MNALIWSTLVLSSCFSPSNHHHFSIVIYGRKGMDTKSSRWKLGHPKEGKCQKTTSKRLDKRSCISSLQPYSSLYFFDYLWHHFNPTAAFWVHWDTFSISERVEITAPTQHDKQTASKETGSKFRPYPWHILFSHLPSTLHTLSTLDSRVYQHVRKMEFKLHNAIQSRLAPIFPCFFYTPRFVSHETSCLSVRYQPLSAVYIHAQL